MTPIEWLLGRAAQAAPSMITKDEVFTQITDSWLQYNTALEPHNAMSHNQSHSSRKYQAVTGGGWTIKMVLKIILCLFAGTGNSRFPFNLFNQTNLSSLSWTNCNYLRDENVINEHFYQHGKWILAIWSQPSLEHLTSLHIVLAMVICLSDIWWSNLMISNHHVTIDTSNKPTDNSLPGAGPGALETVWPGAACVLFYLSICPSTRPIHFSLHPHNWHKVNIKSKYARIFLLFVEITEFSTTTAYCCSFKASWLFYNQKWVFLIVEDT